MTRFAIVLVLVGCNRPMGETPTDAAIDASDAPDASIHQRVTITATVNSTRFVTREHMLAAGEMQISGEPLAETMGRDLANYSRDRIPTDLYFDPDYVLSWTDLAGFSTGVESYEYSKQPMNNLAFESGAGTSLAYGPLVNSDGATGLAATAHLATLIQRFAVRSNALGRFVFAAGTFPTNNPSGNMNPTGAGTGAANPLGWPGIWPTTHVFASFASDIDPSPDVALACAITSDDDPDGMIGSTVISADYECDATSLRLIDRSAQSDATITPGADGFSGWKYGLWVLNYLQVMHDISEAPVTTVSDQDLVSVGAPGNQIAGVDDTGTATAPGTYLGSSDIEGFQAQMFIAMIDNRAADWLARLSTSDGVTLSSFATVQAALDYRYDSPLRWFPHTISVTETVPGGAFPKPAYALASSNSELLDLVGMILAYAEFFALTDTSNTNVGGAQAAIALFDGDPFAADDQAPDGEPTLHDRALAVMRVALIDLDRMHTDPGSGVLVDGVTMTGTTAQRGHTISTTSLAYALLGIRTALRSLGGQLELYSNNTPDTGMTTTPLDALPIGYPGASGLAFSARLDQLLRAQARLLYDHLTSASGRAWRGWDVAANAPIDDADLLDAHTAAIRGLFAAYLATGDVRYRGRAIAVFDRMESVFYDRDAQIYAATPAPVDDVEYTPLRFALLQSTLRDMYELVATRPGGEPRVSMLEDRLARLDKLVLNGWDDRDHNRLVSWPGECVNVVGGVPRGGLQMAERTLTGEIGSLQAPLLPGDPRIVTSDREHDCVPEIDDAHLPAGLAGSITFHLARQ